MARERASVLLLRWATLQRMGASNQSKVLLSPPHPPRIRMSAVGKRQRQLCCRCCEQPTRMKTPLSSTKHQAVWRNEIDNNAAISLAPSPSASPFSLRPSLLRLPHPRPPSPPSVTCWRVSSHPASSALLEVKSESRGGEGARRA